MVLQVSRQIIDGHPVDARCSFVAPDLRQRLPQIVTLDNRFHRRPAGRQAFGGDARRTSFGPCRPRASGFTLRRGREGQVKLGFLPHGSCESAVLLATPPFGPSAARCLLCPLLTSPPRSRASLPAQSGVPDTTGTSRGKTDRLRRTPAGFTTPALDDRGLRDHLLARPAG